MRMGIDVLRYITMISISCGLILSVFGLFILRKGLLNFAVLFWLRAIVASDIILLSFTILHFNIFYNRQKETGYCYIDRIMKTFSENMSLFFRLVFCTQRILTIRNQIYSSSKVGNVLLLIIVILLNVVLLLPIKIINTPQSCYIYESKDIFFYVLFMTIIEMTGSIFLFVSSCYFYYYYKSCIKPLCKKYINDNRMLKIIRLYYNLEDVNHFLKTVKSSIVLHGFSNIVWAIYLFSHSLFRIVIVNVSSYAQNIEQISTITYYFFCIFLSFNWIIINASSQSLKDEVYIQFVITKYNIIRRLQQCGLLRNYQFIVPNTLTFMFSTESFNPYFRQLSGMDDVKTEYTTNSDVTIDSGLTVKSKVLHEIPGLTIYNVHSSNTKSSGRTFKIIGKP